MDNDKINSLINWVTLTVTFIVIMLTAWFVRGNSWEYMIIIAECILGMSVTAYNCVYLAIKHDRPEHRNKRLEDNKGSKVTGGK